MASPPVGSQPAAAEEAGGKVATVPAATRLTSAAPGDQPPLPLAGSAVAFLKKLATMPFLRAAEGDVALREAALVHHRAALDRNRKRLLDANRTQSAHRSGYGRDNRRPARFLQSGKDASSNDDFNGIIRVGLKYQATVTPFVAGAHGTTLTEREQVLCGAPLAQEDSIYVPLRAWSTGEIQAMQASLYAGDYPDFFTAGKAVWDDTVTMAQAVDCYYHYWKQQPNIAHPKQLLWPPPMPRPKAKRPRK